jgi:hypothetical protein
VAARNTRVEQRSIQRDRQDRQSHVEAVASPLHFVEFCIANEIIEASERPLCDGINVVTREAAAFRGVQVDRSPAERPSEMAARQPSNCSRTPTARETLHVDSLGRQPHPETVPLVPNSIFTDTVGDPLQIGPHLPDRAGEQPTHSLRPDHHPTRRCTGELLRPAAD